MTLLAYWKLIQQKRAIFNPVILKMHCNIFWKEETKTANKKEFVKKIIQSAGNKIIFRISKTASLDNLI